MIIDNLQNSCPAPTCPINRKGVCCTDCPRKIYCLDMCLNSPDKCKRDNLLPNRVGE